MLTKAYLNPRDRAVSENAVLKFGIVCTSLATVALAVTVFAIRKQSRTILVPPVIRSQVTITDKTIDDYLVRDWVYFIGALAFSYTPSSARVQFNDLMRFYAPSAYAAANDAWMSLATDIEKSRVTTQFSIDPNGIDINPQQREITVQGLRSQFQDNVLIGTQRTSYTVRYQISAGRFLVTEIGERVKS